MTDELLMKFLLKESTVEENEKVEKWLHVAEANKKHFTQLETIWQLSNTLKTSPKGMSIWHGQALNQGEKV
jgi:transmembrane sensor